MSPWTCSFYWKWKNKRRYTFTQGPLLPKIYPIPTWGPCPPARGAKTVQAVMDNCLKTEKPLRVWIIPDFVMNCKYRDYNMNENVDGSRTPRISILTQEWSLWGEIPWLIGSRAVWCSFKFGTSWSRGSYSEGCAGIWESGKVWGRSQQEASEVCWEGNWKLALVIWRGQ